MATNLAENIASKSYNSGTGNGIASNSLAVEQGALLAKVSWFVEIAAAGEDIVGVSLTNKTFASDNQTVDQDLVIYEEANDYLKIQMPITWGTITQADEGKYFDITSDSDQTVDGTTESASTGQLQLVKFISATKGVFKIANA